MRSEEYLEKVVKNFDKILLIADECEMELTQADIDKIDLADKKILILSIRQMELSGNISVERISGELCAQLRSFYHMYEFADNFVLLNNSQLHATIFNLVRTGVLTSEEAWQALLG